MAKTITLRKTMSFAAIQAEFSGFPPSEMTGADWGDPLQMFMRLHEEKGGLIPQAILPELLSLSKQRVSQLIASKRFEVHQIGKLKFITGNSLEAYAIEEHKAGRGHKAPRFMTVYHGVQKMLKGDLSGQESDEEDAA